MSTNVLFNHLNYPLCPVFALERSVKTYPRPNYQCTNKRMTAISKNVTLSE